MKEPFEERRTFTRYYVKAPVKFFCLYYGRGELVNISPAGIGMATEEKIEPKTHLELWLEVPDDGDGIYTCGEVVWLKENALNQYQVGIKLEDIDLVSMSRLIKKAGCKNEGPTL